MVLGLRGTTTFPRQGDPSSTHELVSYSYIHCLFFCFWIMPIKEFALLRERRPWDLELATCHCFHMQTLGATLSLSIMALCFHILHGCRYLFISSFFFYVHPKLGIWLCPSDSKTNLKSVSCGSDEVWLLSIHQKPPHRSLITPAPCPMPSLAGWQTRGWSNVCTGSADCCADRPATASFRKG